MSRSGVHDLRNALSVALGLVDTVRIDDPVDAERRLSRLRARLVEAADVVSVIEDELDQAQPSSRIEARGERVTIQPPGEEHFGEQIIGGQYRVTSLIGRGGMGTVLLAWDDRLQRHVAVKQLEHDIWGKDDARLAFEHEARAMARVHHPNVVTIHALGEHDGKPYIVMEYVQGETLREHIADGPLALDEALGIIDQVCRGVSAIHRAGVVHRDIKPSNILIGPAFRVAVTDFGLVDEAGQSAPPLHGGTPGYVAPEAVEAGTRPGPAADVYAVGVIMHELLTGVRAFDGDTFEEVVTAQLAGEVAPLSSQRGDLPSSLDAVITKATAPKPEDRHESIDQLRAELFAAREQIAERYDASVMIVDDDHEFRVLLEGLVRQALPGAHTRAFADGTTALAAAQRENFDAAVLDLGLPGLNGFELMTMLRDLQHPVEHVVVVTGEGGAADWELLHQGGANGFLVKPVDETALTALLHKVVPKSKRGVRLSRVPVVPQKRSSREA